MNKMQVFDYVKIDIASPQTCEGLAIFPLLGNNSKLDHLVLSEALKSGLSITEKGSGTVPQLYAVNQTGKNILAIAGEYLIGGRQNRTIIRNIYFDKNFSGNIPVRCVQQGRWSYNDLGRPRIPDILHMPEVVHEFDRQGVNADFAYGGQTPISASVGARNQHETWNSVAKCLCSMGVNDSSSDLNSVYTQRAKDFEEKRKNFKVLDNQIGTLAVFLKNNEKNFILDLFDRNSVMSKYHNNLLDSYILQAGFNNKECTCNKDEAKSFLDKISLCNSLEQTPVSIGKDYKLDGEGVLGSLLVFDNTLAYMNLFSETRNPENPNTLRMNISEVFGPNPNYSSGFYRMY
ncbi:MAG: ARPP-1 family domain-containing protein [Candidatus Nanoarchaeia archaeon]